jgi:hypothetical protein
MAMIRILRFIRFERYNNSGITICLKGYWLINLDKLRSRYLKFVQIEGQAKMK